MALSEHPLGQAALSYIRKRLETGKTFAHAILDAIDLELGRVFAYIPEDATEEAANCFTDGILPTPPESTWTRKEHGTWIPVPNTEEWLTARVHNFLSQSATHIAIFEEWMMPQASDPFWEKNEDRREAATFLGDEVYYIIRAHEGVEVVRQAVNRSGSFWPGGLGALVSPERAFEEKHGDDWLKLASHVVELSIEAYDGETYLIWTPA